MSRSLVRGDKRDTPYGVHRKGPTGREPRERSLKRAEKKEKRKPCTRFVDFERSYGERTPREKLKLIKGVQRTKRKVLCTEFIGNKVLRGENPEREA